MPERHDQRGGFAMTPRAVHAYVADNPQAAIDFLKRTRSELRSLRKVRVFKDKVHVLDINQDYFEILGIGYPDVEIVPLLRMINTAFDPKTLHDPVAIEYKEFATGRRHPWAEDRVM
jgi:hypothetical protein